MNKSYLQVTEILSIIYASVYGLAILVTLYSSLFIMPFFFGIQTLFLAAGIVVNILLAIQAHKGRNGENNRSLIMGLSIAALFFGLIPGILGLVAINSDSAKSNISYDSLESSLKRLNDLYEKGIINKEEYSIRRAKIIDSHTDL